MTAASFGAIGDSYRYIAVTGTNSTQPFSDDTVSFKNRALPTFEDAVYSTNHIGQLQANNGSLIILAAGANGIIKSSDGRNYEDDTSYWNGGSATTQAVQMEYGGGYFVALPQASISTSGQFFYSSNGSSWTQNTGPNVASNPIYRAIYGGSGLALFGVDGSGNGQVWYDTDITKTSAWTKLAFDTAGSRAGSLSSKAGYGNGYFLCTTTQSESTPSIYYATEANVLTSWTRVGVSGAVFFGGLAYDATAGRWSTLYTDSSNNIYCGYSDNNGTSWATADTTFNCFDASSLYGPYEINGVFLACYRNASGDYKTIRSADGATWAELSSPTVQVFEFFENPYS